MPVLSLSAQLLLSNGNVEVAISCIREGWWHDDNFPISWCARFAARLFDRIVELLIGIQQ